MDPARHERLERLAAAARRAPWAADAGFDWDPGVQPPFWLSRAEAAAAVSQLYHGEIATGRLCRRLLDELDDPASRACLELQIRDEARHAAVYRRYLERLGGIAPIDPAVEAALEGASAWRGSVLGMVVAFHVVVEGEALRMQQALSDRFPCPLLRQISRRVALDEARHVAFGRIYLRGRVAALPAEERRAMYRWIEGLWRDCAEDLLAGRSGSGLVIRRLFKGWVARGWRRHARALAEIGLRPDGAAAQVRP